MTTSSDDELPPPVLRPHVSPQPTRARPAAPLVPTQSNGESTVVVSSHGGDSTGHVKEATKDGIVVAFIGCHGKRRKRFSLTKFGDSARTHVDAWVESESNRSKEAASLALQLPGTSSDTQGPTGATGAPPKTQKTKTPPTTQTTGATSATGAKKQKKGCRCEHLNKQQPLQRACATCCRRQRQPAPVSMRNGWTFADEGCQS